MITLTSDQFPRISRLRQRFPRPRVANVAAEVVRQLDAIGLREQIRPGQSVAVTAGSRGIANIALILREIARYIRDAGGQPFLVPAMGSHGGGTAAGQKAVLESYGITEDYCGCPIRSSLETVIVEDRLLGFPIHFDREAFRADHVLVCGRVKPHTWFAGPIESGLMKMLLIGLGKCEGARIYHRAIEDFSFDEIVRRVAPIVLERCRIVGGLAIVENAYDETALIEGVAPKDFMKSDRRLLEKAKALMPRLPFAEIDVLLIDRFGKNISGVGFDPNVVGRKFNEHRAVEGEYPRIKRICLRRLTPESQGNAVGIGMAEFCRTEILREMDVRATRVNALTSGHLAVCMIPPDYPNDREMLSAALTTIGLTPPPKAKLVWILDTLHLETIECSESLLSEVRDRDDLEIVCPLRPLPFDSVGNLPEFAGSMSSAVSSDRP